MSKKERIILSLISLAILLSTLLGLTPIRVKASANCISPEAVIGLNKILEGMNKTLVIHHIRYLSSLGSRVSGYPGFFKAAEYIAEKFTEYGVKPYSEAGYYEYFNITIPLDLGCSITLEDGTRIKAYALWPNVVNPSPYESPPEGDILVYVGEGTPESFKGKDVKGKFVLMRFRSRWYLRFALIHGAKGVIFVPESENEIIRPEAEWKVLSIPVPFPRLYVPPEEGLKLVELCKHNKNGIKVFVKLKMKWISVKVPNVVGFVEGTDPKLSREAIVVASYYDSWSIVPALSPGATDALGIAVLLDFARFVAKNPPTRPVIFVALAGHWQSVWGAREFVERHFNEIGMKIRAFIAIGPLATESQSLGVFAIGSLYSFSYPQVVSSRYGWLSSKLFQEYLPMLKVLLGAHYGDTFIDGILLTYPPYIQVSPPFDPWGMRILDSEPFLSACYGSAFSFYTTNAFRMYQKTPADTIDKINFDNLWPQVQFIFCATYKLLNERSLQFFMQPARIRDDWGYATLYVQVSEYNMTTAYYDPFDAKRHPKLWRNAVVWYQSVGMDVVVLPDKNGIATIHGVKPYQMGSVQAFVLNYTTGGIEWATDFGVFAAPGLNLVRMTTPSYTKIISMFPCASIAVISAYDPNYYQALPTLLVYHFRAHGPMIRQGYIIGVGGTVGGIGGGYVGSSDFMAFVQPNEPAELLLSRGEAYPHAVLNNATPENPSGSGYTLKQGQVLVLGPEDIARNLYYLTKTRYDVAASHYTYTPTIVLYNKLSEEKMDQMETSTRHRAFDTLYGLAYSAWSYLRYLYVHVMDLTWQVILTLVVFFASSILFAVIAERLLFGFVGLQRLMVTLGFFILMQVALFFFHPGYTMSTNSVVVLLSVAILLVVVPLLSFVISEAIRSAREVRRKMVGHHFVEASRTSLFTQAISVGIENMKKRRLRTSLTLLSLVTVVFALVTFASVTLAPVTMPSYEPNIANYEGILIRKVPWQPIPEEAYLAIKSMISGEGVVVPRAWLYAPPLPPGSSAGTTGQPLIFFSPKRITAIYALLALSADEPRVSGIDSFLLKGEWFRPDDIFACIISDAMIANLTKELGRPIGVGSVIEVWGMPLTVRGIINSTALTYFLDLDGELLTPMNILMAQAGVKPPHYGGSQVLIIPYELYNRLATYQQPTPTGIAAATGLVVMRPLYPPLVFVQSIAIKPYNKSAIPQMAEKLAYGLNMDIFFSNERGSNAMKVASRQWFQAIGAANIVVPLVLGAFIMLTSMLGAVQERIREIKVYNAVGMSPRDITSMFLTEATVYAVPSSVLGYLISMIVTYALIIFDLYPKAFYPNYSSLIIIIVFLVTIGVILSASLYPSTMVARIATPSLERKWRVTKPKGDIWVVPLPFVTTSEAETRGVFEFFREFLMSYTSERGTTFYAENVDIFSGVEEGKSIKRIIAKMRMAPYDLGITQEAVLEAVAGAKERYSYRLVIKRLSGYRDPWISSNMIFIDAIRKQWLIWRTLRPEERRKYILKAMKIFKE